MQVYEEFRRDIPVVKKSARLSDDEELFDSAYRHNHGAKSKSTHRRKTHGPPSVGTGSIGQLVAAESSLRRKKRRSRESANNSIENIVEVDETGVTGVEGAGARAEVSPNKENIQETLRMNRSAHKKRLQRLMERADEDLNNKKNSKDAKLFQRKSIKEEERFKIIEQQFAGGSSHKYGKYVDWKDEHTL